MADDFGSLMDLETASTTASSVGSTRRRRQMRVATSEKFFDQLTGEKYELDKAKEKAAIARVCEDDEVREIVKAVIAKHQQKKLKEAQALRSSIGHLRDMPQYRIRQVLAVLTGIDEAFFTNMDEVDLRCLYYLAVNGGPGTKPPNRHQTPEQHLLWCQTRYEQAGKPLATLSYNEASAVDWETLVGAVRFVIPNNPSAETMIEQICIRATGALFFVTDPFPFKDLGMNIVMEDNYSVSTAKIMNQDTGSTQLVTKVMARAAPASVS